MTDAARVVLVSGLSGAGKSSILRALEDLGYEAVDNPPLPLLTGLVADQVRGGTRLLAVGVDVRTSGFDAGAVLAALDHLRADPALRPELVYATAEEGALLRRYTETRRRHPLAPQGRVADGIAAEIELTAELRMAADLTLDTSDLTLATLRHAVEQRFGSGPLEPLTVSLVSFAFPAGLPREADMVLDARFLRNPYYDPILRPRTGLDAEVGAYVEADADYRAFFAQTIALLELLLPRFVREGKKYVTLAVGCTGGRHRSVHFVERLAATLTRSDRVLPSMERGWKVSVTHRELARAGRVDRQDNVRAAGGSSQACPPAAIQAQEA